MTIKAIVIQGQNGDIEITRTASGAQVTCNHEVLAEVGRDDDQPEALYAKARAVAGAVYGTDRHGRVAATNSMVHDVMSQIQVVAGM